MNETDWLDCINPWLMLRHLEPRISDRKLRLFACAWCRVNNWETLPDENCRLALEIGERFADGMASDDERENIFWLARESAWQVILSVQPGARGGMRLPWDTMVGTAAQVMDWHYWGFISGAGLGVVDWPRECVILRDIFGNPFRPITVDPTWLTANVTALAQTIYDERAFDRMPVLGDALEDAGCINRDVLDHCRGPGPHVRGCWLVDLLLAKE